jgi:RimJ/RimL family protein N-acetyltransferase
VKLTPLDDALTERLLKLAVADSTPEEVIPPVEGPPGWTPARQEFFRAFHHERQEGLAGPLRTVMFAIEADNSLIGMIRLTLDDDGTAGARTVRADTTPANRAALAVLSRAGAALEPRGDKVYARLELDS